MFHDVQSLHIRFLHNNRSETLLLFFQKLFKDHMTWQFLMTVTLFYFRRDSTMRFCPFIQCFIYTGYIPSIQWGGGIFFNACITSTTSSVCGRHCSNSIALGMAFLLVIILAIKKPPLNAHHLIQEGFYQKQFRIVFNILSTLLFQHKISKCLSDSTDF